MVKKNLTIDIVAVKTVEEIENLLTLPDLVLVNMNQAMDRCPNLLLIAIFETIPVVPVMCFSADEWICRERFRVHARRLIVLPCDELQHCVERFIESKKRGGQNNLLFIDKPLNFLNVELEDTFKRLSSRELEILCLLGKGMGSPEISGALGCKRNTIDSHLRSVRHKIKRQGSYGLRSIAVQMAQADCCQVFSRCFDHICPCRGESVGSCPIRMPK
jgi:DNA-binding CsgD family transcriptional regulator